VQQEATFSVALYPVQLEVLLSSAAEQPIALRVPLQHRIARVVLQEHGIAPRALLHSGLALAVLPH